MRPLSLKYTISARVIDEKATRSPAGSYLFYRGSGSRREAIIIKDVPDDCVGVGNSTQH